MADKTMLGIHFIGESQIRLNEVPLPEANQQMVLVKVHAAAICGTDRENLEGAGQDVIPGHENAGQVVAVDQAGRVKPGDRVAINCHITCGQCPHCTAGDLYFCEALSVVGFDIDGGFAEYVLVPESTCMPLPDDISYEAGSLMMDVFGTAYRGVLRSNPRPGDRVAIWGAGPIGLAALITARWLGCEAAILDLNPYRLEMARTLGAERVINPASDDWQSALLFWTEGDGLAIGYDCVGSETAIHQALEVLRPRATLGIIGVSHQLTVNPWEHFIQREMTFVGSRNFTLAQFDPMIAMIRAGAPIEQVVTHRFPVAEADAAFELFKSAECGKIILTG
jgi:threonine dehydrogenase-like Zn-dependent dehydrogenase